MNRDTDDFGSDLGTASKARPSAIVEVLAPERSKRDTVRRYLEECRLDGLQGRGEIQDREWRAGILFRAKWLAAFKGGGYEANYRERVHNSAAAHRISEAQAERISAQDRVREALETLGEIESLAVSAVAGEDEEVRGFRRLHALRAGLVKLADFYGVAQDFRRRPGA